MKLSMVGLALAGLAAMSVGCDDGGGGDPAPSDAAIIGGGGSGGGAGGAGGGTGETEAALRLTYIKQSGTNTDLIVYDFDEDAELNLTASAGIDCRNGCTLNADMTWMAWLGGTADPSDQTLKVAPVDVVRKEIRTDRTRVVAEGVRRFEFTGHRIVYEKGQAMGTDRTIEILVEPIAGCEEGDGSCPQFVGNIGGNGGFRVSDVGSVIVALDISLSAMTINLFNAENGLSQTIYTFGDQGGTGSPFSGRQPVGMAPDQSYMVAFTPEDFLWRANILELRPSPPPAAQFELFESQSNPDPGPCNRAGDYFFTGVEYNPVFSSDSEYFYFLATGGCSQAPGAENRTNRPDSDILRLPRDVSGAMVENITNNPRVSHWSNQEIRDFDLAPESDHLAYVAPRPNDASSQAIWIINPEGGAFNCDRDAGQMDLGGVQRCEFIFDEGAPGVKYRSLQFVTVQIPR
jgi:hypothetical protein